MNKLPKEWCVYNDGSQLFKDTVLAYLGTITGDYYGGLKSWFYGINYSNDKVYWSMHSWGTVLSLNEFIKLTTEDEVRDEFKVGEDVEVRDDDCIHWYKGKFVVDLSKTGLPGAKGYVCYHPDGLALGFTKGSVYTWENIRKVKPPVDKIKAEITFRLHPYTEDYTYDRYSVEGSLKEIAEKIKKDLDDRLSKAQ